MARIVVLEKGLADRVEIVPAQTRPGGQPVLPHQSVGPGAVSRPGRRHRPGGILRRSAPGSTSSTANRRSTLPAGDAGWEARRLEGLARSWLDGLSVWLREFYRPPDERSPGVIRHETARSERMVDLWEKEIAHPLMHGALNMQQPHARLRPRARGAQSRLPLAARPSPARRVVRPDRDAPVVRGDRAARRRVEHPQGKNTLATESHGHTRKG